MSDIQKLQRVQNIAVRIIERVAPSAAITPLLVNLHWLPIDKRVQFKILFLTFKALHGSAPSYISSLLQPYIPSRTLRSQQNHLLIIPRSHTQYYGDRSFASIAPTLWNRLPIIIRTAPSLDSFKNQLKTFLFEE